MRVSRGQETEETVPDADGAYQFEAVPFGDVTLTIFAEKYEKDEWTVHHDAETTEQPPKALITVATGSQLRGLVRSFSGKGIQALITLTPLGMVTETDAKGAFQIDLEPGIYTVEIEAAGYRKQTRRVVVELNSVNILNVDLRRKKR